MTLPVYHARHPLPGGHVLIDVGRKTTDRLEFGADCSRLGNPHTIRKQGTWEEVIALYRQWLPTRLRAGSVESRALQGLAERVRAGEQLLLSCAPLASDADVLQGAVERRVGGA